MCKCLLHAKMALTPTESECNLRDFGMAAPWKRKDPRDVRLHLSTKTSLLTHTSPAWVIGSAGEALASCFWSETKTLTASRRRKYQRFQIASNEHCTLNQKLHALSKGTPFIVIMTNESERACERVSVRACVRACVWEWVRLRENAHARVCMCYIYAQR